ncbi:uncharacterized protein LOC100571368 [Acyrthosiphon pisum]|uniref:C2H2-type domain-containing protein n=1 Tax=Acyrthosiphon pisum TaxID=7029 RepID=A0A8R2FBH0_ACYPI|nr:uncharacterized protein LOC100571368 [Acyrthosiphon pisum]|eukprot:XP_008187073.1 PREDICTED: uncharacterized protein LOC100571368 [Acyrthosiphon pisum]
MTETELTKNQFFKLLNLEAINPENDSSMIFRNHLLVKPCHDAYLAYKNNNIKTGYENFCVEKGTLKLFPFKDFDFIGKLVVCQKCCQKFASLFSYKAHAGTDICVRTDNGPNLIYLKYKNRNSRQVRKKNKRKPKENVDGHEIERKLSNPEILNTLQTRKKVYSDNIIQKQNKVKEKVTNYSYEYNDEPSVKKRRGRPKKDINRNNLEVNLKKRGRPKKLNAVIFDSSNQNENSSSSKIEITESFNMKYLLEKFWKLFSKEFKPKLVDINKHQYPTKHKNQYKKEKKGDLSAEENEIFLKIEELEYDFEFLFKQFKGKKEYPFNDELELILTKICKKRDEIKQSLLKKTDMKISIPDKGKENIKHTLKKNKSETEIEMNNKDFDKNEKCIGGIWINNTNTVSPTITMKMNDGCTFMNHINEDNLKNESTSQDIFEDNLKTLRVDKTPNITNSVKNHLNDLDLNYIINPTLNCKKCRKKFTSIAECKLHRSEHLVKISTSFLCSVCGLRFKIYKNFRKHINIHKKKGNKISSINKSFKNLVCKICNKQYDYLRSYYAHIKTHVNK